MIENTRSHTVVGVGVRAYCEVKGGHGSDMGCKLLTSLSGILQGERSPTPGERNHSSHAVTKRIHLSEASHFSQRNIHFSVHGGIN